MQKIQSMQSRDAGSAEAAVVRFGLRIDQDKKGVKIILPSCRRVK